jgi:hypothetical protein
MFPTCAIWRKEDDSNIVAFKSLKVSGGIVQQQKNLTSSSFFHFWKKDFIEPLPARFHVHPSFSLTEIWNKPLAVLDTGMCFQFVDQCARNFVSFHNIGAHDKRNPIFGFFFPLMVDMSSSGIRRLYFDSRRKKG